MAGFCLVYAGRAALDHPDGQVFRRELVLHILVDDGPPALAAR
jgi:hypothetical protein